MRKIVSKLIVFIILFHCSASLSNECKSLEKSVWDKIHQSQSCEKDSDCVRIPPGVKCPFGCSLRVNKNKLKEVVEASVKYHKQCQECTYDCMDPIGAGSKCDSKTCKATLLERPIASKPLIVSEIVITPEMKTTVNSETLDNKIPWVKDDEKYSVKIKAEYVSDEQLIKATKGDWTNTLYRFVYKVSKVIEGDFKEKELSFFVIRRFPAPHSGLIVKELWPFGNSSSPLIFKLSNQNQENLIVSIGKERMK